MSESVACKLKLGLSIWSGLSSNLLNMEMALPLMGRVFSHQVAEQQVNREESSMEPGVSMSKGLVFNGSTLLWSSMLEDTAGLRSAIIPGEATTPDDDIFEYEENIGASLILGSAVPLPLQKVLFQYLPPRQEADRLTAAYFGSSGVSSSGF